MRKTATIGILVLVLGAALLAEGWGRAAYAAPGLSPTSTTTPTTPPADPPGLVNVLPSLSESPQATATASIAPAPSVMNPTSTPAFIPTDEPTSVPLVKPLPPDERMQTPISITTTRTIPITATPMPHPKPAAPRTLSSVASGGDAGDEDRGSSTTGQRFSPYTAYYPTYYTGLMPSHGGWTEPQDIPKFMTLPFAADPYMVLLQGWFYDSGGLQSGIDYFRYDENERFTSFPILAAADGYACGQWDPNVGFVHTGGGCVAGYGHRVLIRHEVEGHTYYTYYGHLETIDSAIPLGDRSDTAFVERGQFLGYAGNTGTGGSPIHLHFGIFDEYLGWYDPYDIRATHEVYPDPNRTNRLRSGFNDFWMTNPPSYPDEFYMNDDTFLRPGLEQFWNPEFPSYTLPEDETWEPLGAVLAPRHNSSVSGTIQVRGWAVDESTSVNAIEIWVDDELHRTADYGLFSEEAGGDYGFNLDWDTTSEANGVHTLQVRAVAEDGSRALLPVQGESARNRLVVNVQNLRGVIESPAPEAVVSERVMISGWARTENSHISKVEIWIDGEPRGVATYGQPREDIGGNYGFQWEWDTTREEQGMHTVQVRAVAFNGERTLLVSRGANPVPALSLSVKNRPSFGAGRWHAR